MTRPSTERPVMHKQVERPIRAALSFIRIGLLPAPSICNTHDCRTGGLYIQYLIASPAKPPNSERAEDF